MSVQKLVDYTPITKSCFKLFKPFSSTKKEWQKFRLSLSELVTYKQNGFVSNVRLLNDFETTSLLNQYPKFIASAEYFQINKGVNVDNKYTDEEIEELTHIYDLMHEIHANETHDKDNVLFHCLGHWRSNVYYHDLIYHPNITIKSSQLLFVDSITLPELLEFKNLDDMDRYLPNVRFWHDQLFSKPPKSGGNVALHQDYSYWQRTKPMQHLTIHIALDKQTTDNGCILYVKGSHKWYRFDDNGNILPLPITDQHFIDYNSIKTVLTKEELVQFENPENTVECELDPGCAAFHHPLCVHGSKPNRSDRSRRACVLNVFKDGTVTNTDEALLVGMPAIPKGQKLESEFNPLIFDSSVLQ